MGIELLWKKMPDIGIMMGNASGTSWNEEAQNQEARSSCHYIHGMFLKSIRGKPAKLKIGSW